MEVLFKMLKDILIINTDSVSVFKYIFIGFGLGTSFFTY